MIIRASRRELLRYGTVAAAVAALPSPSIAQVWPSKPIKITVGYPAGGLTDTFARAYGEYISQKTGQPVVVENKAGASGAIAAEQVKNAPPDGHHLMWTISTTMIMNKVLFKKLPYDPDKDFALISWMDAGHLPLVVNAKLPIRNLAELAAYARANKTSLGTYGAGSYSHVAVEALNRHYNLTIQPVHYRGEAPMWIDVGSGAVQGGSGSYAASAGMLQSGNGRAIAVPTKQRMRKLPDVATFYEQGVEDIAFQVQGFICLVGPAAMPKDVVKKLSDLMVEAGKTERIQKILDTFGIDNAARDHVFFEKFVADQGPVWLKLVKDLNLEPQ
ncbi:MAG: tripartite tricarboxylate transporter substrate binding protein [Enhydrobacter sp.]|nr:MAG: tripartite tricarboxylate transporter substrate binding protein [Enhydrobacter sp.]